MVCKKYSIQKVTQFSHGNNVLDAYASNTDGFLFRDTCVSSTQLNKPVWNIKSLNNLEKPNSRKYSFQKLTQLSQGNELDTAASNIDRSFRGRCMHFFNSAE
jgi:hypothetical protein